MSLAEWRAAVDGYTEAVMDRRREQAWVLSHQLVAAGCDAEKVTPAKLLGEKEKKPKRTPIYDPETQQAMERKKILARIARDTEKRKCQAST